MYKERFAFVILDKFLIYIVGRLSYPFLPKQLLQHQKDRGIFSLSRFYKRLLKRIKEQTTVENLKILLIMAFFIFSIFILSVFVLFVVLILISGWDDLSWIDVYSITYILMFVMCFVWLSFKRGKNNWTDWRKEREKRSQLLAKSFRDFAQAKNLKYRKLGCEYWIYGEYKVGEVVFYVDEFAINSSITCIPNSSEGYNYPELENMNLLETQPVAENVTKALTNKMFSDLVNPVKFDINGGRFYYELDNIPLSFAQLQNLFDLLITISHNYAKVVAIGSELYPALQTIGANKSHPLHSIAIQALKDIAQETTNKFQKQSQKLLCPRCFTYRYKNDVVLPTGDKITYFGCRLCGQSRRFIEVSGQVISLLDNQVSEKEFGYENNLYVNWLKHRRPFDFARVEIVQAVDEDVERFAVQVGNDTDEIRKSRYKQMKCFVSPECELSENTLKVLKKIFGQVEIGKTTWEHREVGI